MEDKRLEFTDGQCSLVLGEVGGVLKAVFLKNPTQTEVTIKQICQLSRVSDESARVLIDGIRDGKQIKNSCLNFVKDFQKTFKA